MTGTQETKQMAALAAHDVSIDNSAHWSEDEECITRYVYYFRCTRHQKKYYVTAIIIVS